MGKKYENGEGTGIVSSNFSSPADNLSNKLVHMHLDKEKNSIFAPCEKTYINKVIN